ncbi:radical SAM protein [Methanolobus halotolerans]|uniref:Radical SAM protein n=1 Tax=Methanolobus halotolerans TaxID=2052935 RepID=A0A4E0PWB2_9EURY|nr:radical SAM protein [Methanolobus halotolerans]TGC08723.1 radical SAM protein [Methanolobus halotolerans]
MEQIGTVQSLCPECLKRIEGIKYVENDRVYIKKECADHGSFTSLVSMDVNHYLQMKECFDVDRAKAKEPLTDTEKGCPFDCGLCPSHKQDTCLAVVEVTDRCNMKCTYCFANSSMDASLDPDMETIRKMFETVKRCQNDPTCIQISGGEPTLRDDLPEIIRMGKEVGIAHIELNTNGIRIARDQDYFNRIASAGIDAIYLGFDGVSDDVYRQRTGRDMINVKTEVINRCEKAGIGVVLVPLVAKDYNLHEVGRIIDFAASRVPAVRGVHFQPVFYSGRSPSEMQNRVTILELLESIEEQTSGQLKVNNFTPSLMPHAHCGATCLTLVDNGGFLPLTNLSSGAVQSASDVASKTKKSIMGRWKGLEKEKESKQSCGDLLIKGSCCEKPLSDITVKSSCCEKPLTSAIPGSGSGLSGGWADFIEMSKNNYLTISTMAFQDVWSYEQDRVENCCIHVVTRDCRFIPFCNYNMTSCNGDFLYRNAT